MKFELKLDAEKIYEALNQADGDNAESLSLVIIGNIDKDEKVKVSKIYLHGECVTEYTCNIS
jgi:hypothetical protein